MYKLTKNVIEMGGFNLTEMLRKIDSLWVKGSLSDGERADLYAIAQTRAKAKDSIDMVGVVSKLEARIAVLENKIKKTESDTEGEETTPEESTSYAEFVAGKWYYAGDMVAFGDKTYRCTAPEGAVCVWSPTDYPAYWEEV